MTLAVVVWRLGAGPFLDGVRAVDAGALAAAAAVGLLTTVCCAWRWTIVARGLGVRLSLPAAVAAYYRSLFLNLTRSWMPLVAIALVATVTGIVFIGRARPGGGRSRWARLRGAVTGDVRDGLLTRRALPVIAFTSAVVVLSHAVTFMIAARTAGATAPASRMLPLALLAMMAMVLPSVAGWGAREGAMAWAADA